MQRPIGRIIQVLLQQCDEEEFEINHGQRVTAKVVNKQVIAEALSFGSHSNNYMRNVIETIEFFQVEAKPNDAEEQYDLNKIILFCLLFFEESEDVKTNILFSLMCNRSNLITTRSEQVKIIIAMLTIISCMIPAELIKTVSKLEI